MGLLVCLCLLMYCVFNMVSLFREVGNMFATCFQRIVVIICLQESVIFLFFFLNNFPFLCEIKKQTVVSIHAVHYFFRVSIGRPLFVYDAVCECICVCVRTCMYAHTKSVQVCAYIRLCLNIHV